MPPLLQRPPVVGSYLIIKRKGTRKVLDFSILYGSDASRWEQFCVATEVYQQSEFGGLVTVTLASGPPKRRELDAMFIRFRGDSLLMLLVED